ncbi:SnoaL-like domain-containing protein [Colwellia chukchiensis]|uniref:SnoaL-like domain-containing protein n=1 Tax=Colwellia chukchiensis TaxID=641665 RepID=A0A1H7RGA3_9GAMM|nr:nuclear transport factor 2 family protein [Colwellia chukchiensis]SEL58874.1 SnoaL-like domain-containing protein [Colwellia chukchiensis]
MYKFILVCLLVSGLAKANTELDLLLDNFHQAAAEAHYERYMALLADDAIYLGTDSSERWTKSEFAAFVKPYFSQGRGWLYHTIERHITKSQVSDIAFFDELLENKNYGRCRGSGVLINTEHGWKILQYNLSIPIPNALARQVVKSIKSHQKAVEN